MKTTTYYDASTNKWKKVTKDTNVGSVSTGEVTASDLADLRTEADLDLYNGEDLSTVISKIYARVRNEESHGDTVESEIGDYKPEPLIVSDSYALSSEDHGKLVVCKDLPTDIELTLPEEKKAGWVFAIVNRSGGRQEKVTIKDAASRIIRYNAANGTIGSLILKRNDKVVLVSDGDCWYEISSTYAIYADNDQNGDNIADTYLRKDSMDYIKSVTQNEDHSIDFGYSDGSKTTIDTVPNADKLTNPITINGEVEFDGSKDITITEFPEGLHSAKTVLIDGEGSSLDVKGSEGINLYDGSIAIHMTTTEQGEDGAEPTEVSKVTVTIDPTGTITADKITVDGQLDVTKNVSLQGDKVTVDHVLSVPNEKIEADKGMVVKTTSEDGAEHGTITIGDNKIAFTGEGDTSVMDATSYTGTTLNVTDANLTNVDADQTITDTLYVATTPEETTLEDGTVAAIKGDLSVEGNVAVSNTVSADTVDVNTGDIDTLNVKRIQGIGTDDTAGLSTVIDSNAVIRNTGSIKSDILQTPELHVESGIRTDPGQAYIDKLQTNVSADLRGQTDVQNLRVTKSLESDVNAVINTAGGTITIGDNQISIKTPILGEDEQPTGEYNEGHLTATNYDGLSARATGDEAGNNIIATYATKDELDQDFGNLENEKVNRAGDTMTGDLVMKEAQITFHDAADTETGSITADLYTGVAQNAIEDNAGNTIATTYFNKTTGDTVSGESTFEQMIHTNGVENTGKIHSTEAAIDDNFVVTKGGKMGSLVIDGTDKTDSYPNYSVAVKGGIYVDNLNATGKLSSANILTVSDITSMLGKITAGQGFETKGYVHAGSIDADVIDLNSLTVTGDTQLQTVTAAQLATMHGIENTGDLTNTGTATLKDAAGANTVTVNDTGIDISGSTTIDGTTTVTGTTTIGKEDQTDAITVNGTVGINGNTAIDGDTINLTGTTTITGVTTIDGNTTIGSGDGADTIAVNGTTNVTGATTVTGKLTQNGEVDINSDTITITGAADGTAATITSTANVTNTGDATLASAQNGHSVAVTDNGVAITGTITNTGDITVKSNNVTIGGTEDGTSSTITSTATITNTGDITTTNLNTNQNVSVGGTLGVTGTTSVSTIEATGKIQSDVGFESLEGRVDAKDGKFTGVLDVNELDVNTMIIQSEKVDTLEAKNAIIDNTLTVGVDITTEGTEDEEPVVTHQDGHLTTDYLTVKKQTDLEGKINIPGTLNVTGEATLGKTTAAETTLGSLNVSGNTTLTGVLNANGGASTPNLEVTTTSTLSGNTTITGDVNLGSDDGSPTTTTITGTNIINGETHINDALEVAAETTITGNVTANTGTITLENGATVHRTLTADNVEVNTTMHTAEGSETTLDGHTTVNGQTDITGAVNSTAEISVSDEASQNKVVIGTDGTVTFNTANDEGSVDAATIDGKLYTGIAQNAIEDNAGNVIAETYFNKKTGDTVTGNITIEDTEDAGYKLIAPDAELDKATVKADLQTKNLKVEEGAITIHETQYGNKATIDETGIIYENAEGHPADANIQVNKLNIKGGVVLGNASDLEITDGALKVTSTNRSDFEGPVYINDDAQITNLTVTGNTHVGSITIDGTITGSGSMTLEHLTVNQDTTLNNSVSVKGKLTVSDDASGNNVSITQAGTIEFSKNNELVGAINGKNYSGTANTAVYATSEPDKETGERHRDADTIQNTYATKVELTDAKTELDDKKVNRAGDTMTGDLRIEKAEAKITFADSAEDGDTGYITKTYYSGKANQADNDAEGNAIRTTYLHRTNPESQTVESPVTFNSSVKAKSLEVTDGAITVTGGGITVKGKNIVSTEFGDISALQGTVHAMYLDITKNITSDDGDIFTNNGVIRAEGTDHSYVVAKSNAVEFHGPYDPTLGQTVADAPIIGSLTPTKYSGAANTAIYAVSEDLATKDEKTIQETYLNRLVPQDIEGRATFTKGITVHSDEDSAIRAIGAVFVNGTMAITDGTDPAKISMSKTQIMAENDTDSATVNATGMTIAKKDGSRTTTYTASGIDFGNGQSLTATQYTGTAATVAHAITITDKDGAHAFNGADDVNIILSSSILTDHEDVLHQNDSMILNGGGATLTLDE